MHSGTSALNNQALAAVQKAKTRLRNTTAHCVQTQVTSTSMPLLRNCPAQAQAVCDLQTVQGCLAEVSA